MDEQAKKHQELTKDLAVDLRLAFGPCTVVFETMSDDEAQNEVRG